MLFRFPLPTSFGYTGYYTNIGDMVNRGVEVELSGDVIRTRDLTWNLYANLTSNHNEVTRLPEERRTQHYWDTDGNRYDGFSSGSYYYSEGLSAYSYMTHKFAGLDENGKSLWYKTVYKKGDDGKYIYEDENETIKVFDHIETTDNYSEADDYIVGDIMPRVYGGFGTSLEWKGLDLGVNFAYQLGGKVYDSTYASLMGNSAGRAMHEDLLNAWTPANTDSDIPRWQYNDTYMNGGSDRFLISANYLSLQNITLGYTLPKQWTKKLHIEKIRIYGVADTVWVWSKRRGLDPRMALAGAINNTYYSPIRTISGGISVTF